ncbi:MULTISPECIES: hypothetical protein [Brasilonema]|uniref:hypothetical protein n=1 Tax=Brasilonema TaxID=383614 RepID=UPI00145C83B6|nr:MULTISPECIES: hypothetical protein [Brasilonema]
MGETTPHATSRQSRTPVASTEGTSARRWLPNAVAPQDRTASPPHWLLCLAVVHCLMHNSLPSLISSNINTRSLNIEHSLELNAVCS